METVIRRSRLIVGLVTLCVGLFSACTSEPTPTITAVQVPTSGATVTIPPSQETGTPIIFATRTPVSLPTVTPHVYCDGVPETFLIIAERGRVTDTGDDETLNLRSGPGTEYGILVQIEPLETFYVLDGVQCSGGYAWFQINYQGQIGWIAEGDNEQYYAEPYLTG